MEVDVVVLEEGLHVRHCVGVHHDVGTPTKIKTSYRITLCGETS